MKIHSVVLAFERADGQLMVDTRTHTHTSGRIKESQTGRHGPVYKLVLHAVKGFILRCLERATGGSECVCLNAVENLSL